jgi:hypothetical protein
VSGFRSVEYSLVSFTVLLSLAFPLHAQVEVEALRKQSKGGRELRGLLCRRPPFGPDSHQHTSRASRILLASGNTHLWHTRTAFHSPPEPPNQCHLRRRALALPPTATATASRQKEKRRPNIPRPGIGGDVALREWPSHAAEIFSSRRRPDPGGRGHEAGQQQIERASGRVTRYFILGGSRDAG